LFGLVKIALLILDGLNKTKKKTQVGSSLFVDILWLEDEVNVLFLVVQLVAGFDGGKGLVTCPFPFSFLFYFF